MNAETFVEEAHRIMEWDPHFVVKLPTVPQGLESANILHGEVPINFTLVFSQHQGHLAADYGGAYVSPFVGRIDDKLKDPSLIVEDNMPSDGMDLVEKIIHEYNEFDFSTMVLTASTRSEDHLKRAAECGSHLATIPFNLLKSIHDNHPDRGIELFAVLKKSRFHTPKNLSKPTYSSSFNWMKMKHFERELTINGVERFLADAQSAWYSIIDKD
jgi:transaldolase